MAHIVDIKSKNPLLGKWKCCDGFSDIQFTVSADDGNFTVTGIDTSDGEHAEIHGVSFSLESHTLSFAAHWPRTGRFMKYKFQPAIASGRADVTYSFTTQETWEKV